MPTILGERDDSAAGMELQPDAFSDAPHATVLAHENVLLRMSSPGAIAPPFPVEMWPTVLLCYLPDGTATNWRGVCGYCSRHSF